MKKVILVMLLAFALPSMAGKVWAGQQPPEEKPQPEVAQIKDRVSLFYRDVLKNDRMAALDLVATDSKNRFLNNRYDGLSDFRITGIEIEQNGDRATVRVVRVMQVPNFGQALDLEINDTWQRSGGQWYLVLPPPDELDTPFGKMKFGTDSKPTESEADAMKQRIQQRYQNVDPDQYIRALQKVANNSTTDELKSTDKQQPQTAPTTKPAEKPKPQP